MDEARKRTLLKELVSYLTAERGQPAPGADADVNRLWNMFRALVNTRPPEPASRTFLAGQDELLRGLIAEAGEHGLEDATPSPIDGRLLLWRGDITTLRVDAIVNAANSQMLGCWAPGHFCIDNAIHTFAGVQLRRECYELMEAQGHEEPTGQAKVTRAWNLPAKAIIHTVGPIAGGHPTDLHRAQLAASYQSCLDAAAQRGFGSLAFCCISTGVFGFPQAEAAQIALDTVRGWLRERPDARLAIVFNVFSASDEGIYRRLLSLD